MPGGRRPKSIRIHALSGAMEKNPQRFRDRQAQPDCDLPLGPAPEDWIARAAAGSPEGHALVKSWEEISEALALFGLGNAGDRLAVRAACQLKIRVDRPGFKMADFNGYRSMLNELGLTEAGRARMGRPAQTGDPLDGDFGEYRRSPARRTA